MVVHNVRSPEQWSIISRHIDFQGKTVLDLGCGKGDILFRAFEAGAKAIGIDLVAENVKYIQETYPDIEVAVDNIESMIEIFGIDIIICFSVLPYLRNPGVILQWINGHSDIAFIECQYAGDGPGFSGIHDSNDMREWLLTSGQFKKAEPIGYTLVEGRNKKRYIWMCE
jgi:SAM-dependent methyltransferase